MLYTVGIVCILYTGPGHGGSGGANLVQQVCQCLHHPWGDPWDNLGKSEGKPGKPWKRPGISEKLVMLIMVYESFWPWIGVNHVKSPFLRQNPPVDHVASWDMPLFWEGEAWLRVPTFQANHRNVGWSQLFEPLWLRGKILAKSWPTFRWSHRSKFKILTRCEQNLVEEPWRTIQLAVLYMLKWRFVQKISHQSSGMSSSDVQEFDDLRRPEDVAKSPPAVDHH